MFYSKENKLKQLNEFFKKPNQTTLDAYKEVIEIKVNPKNYKTFKSVDSLIKDLFK